MKLKGKKIACFIALPQHTRFFLPIREKIMEHGGELLFIVPLTEYPFELDLVKRRLPFKYYTDYMNDTVRHKVKEATNELLNNWITTAYKWDGFSRWPLYKQSWFFEALVEEYFCMERFVEVERPDMLIANHECSRWAKVMGHIAYKKAIPFLTFQEGDYHTDQMAFTVHTEFSVLDLLWGRHTIDFLKKYKCSSDKMIPIGNTHIDGAISEYGSPEMIAQTKSDINIPSGKKVVLFLLDILYAGFDKKDVWEKLLEGLEVLSEEAVCVFKWHPHAYQATFSKVQEIFRELYPSAVLLYTYDPYKLLAIADCCVTFGKTSLAVEALAFGKPLFSFPSSDTHEDPYVEMGVSQSIFPPGNWSRLVDTIRNGTPAHIQVKADEYVTDYFYKLDGKSVERTVETMKYILDVRKEGQKKKALKTNEFVPGRFSFIIPSGGDSEVLLATLTSLSQNVKHPDWEVVIVANDKEMKEILSDISGDVKIVEQEGDSLALLYNKGAEAATGEYVVFMRPGIVYFKDEGLFDVIKDNVAGFKVKNNDMTPYCYGIGFDFNFSPYFITDESRLPDAVGGGFIAMSRKVYEKVGGFDEGIANHLIESDLCLKSKELNIPISYLPESLAFNYKETFFGTDASDEMWKRRAKFYVKWLGRLPKDDDFLTFVKDLLKI